VLREILEVKEDEGREHFGTLHGHELVDLYRSPSVIFFQLASTVLICGPWPSLMDFSIHRHLIGLLCWEINPTHT
jgi:hypothetical protein